VADVASLVVRYYLRLWIADRPGVLAQIARVLGEMDISIASVLQKDSDPSTGTAEIVITTHPARESAVQRSLTMLEGLEVVSSVRNMIRIEEW
jgi:homoserine dehydrogenase